MVIVIVDCNYCTADGYVLATGEAGAPTSRTVVGDIRLGDYYFHLVSDSFYMS